VTINDRLPVERNYIVKPTTITSEKGGEVKQDDNKPAFFYTPAKDFAGDDAFTYLLIDEDSGLQDEGRVTIWVKSPKAKTCYTADILTCWGEKNVRAALSERGIEPGNSSMEQLVATLLASLAETKGFTENDIFSSVLEEEPERKQLLGCLGINTENATYDQLGQMILDYQKSNCGAIDTPPPTNCTSKRVVGSVRDNTGKTIPGAAIIVQGTNIGTTTNADGNFVISFPNPGVNLVISVVGFQQFIQPICNESTVSIILNPVTSGEVVVVGVKPANLDSVIISEILTAKGNTTGTTANLSREELIKLATEDKEEITLKSEELSTLKNDTLRVIAESKNISVRSTDTKAILIGRILGS
jgi:hypothetical protein